MAEKADIGLIGLAVMGQNLVLNMADHGYRVAVFNRTTSKVDDFVNGPAKNTAITGTYSLEELVASLEKPRKVMLMVKAGDVGDRFIDMLVPLLEPGDVIIDVVNLHVWGKTLTNVDESGYTAASGGAVLDTSITEPTAGDNLLFFFVDINNTE